MRITLSHLTLCPLHSILETEVLLSYKVLQGVDSELIPFLFFPLRDLFLQLENVFIGNILFIQRYLYNSTYITVPNEPTNSAKNQWTTFIAYTATGHTPWRIHTSGRADIHAVFRSHFGYRNIALGFQQSPRVGFTLKLSLYCPR